MILNFAIIFKFSILNSMCRSIVRVSDKDGMVCTAFVSVDVPEASGRKE